MSMLRQLGMHAQSDVMLPLLLLLRAGAAGAAAVIGMVQGQADCLHCMGAQHVLQRQHRLRARSTHFFCNLRCCYNRRRQDALGC